MAAQSAKCAQCGLRYFTQSTSSCPRCGGTGLASASGGESSSSRRLQLTIAAIVVPIALIAGWVAAGGVMSPKRFPADWGLTRPEEDRLAAGLAPLEVLETHPRWGSATAGMSDPHQVGLELGRRGVMRLGERDLVRLNQLRLELVRSSLPVCAGVWRGWAPGSELAHALLSLSDSELTEWARISARAATLELESEGAAVPREDALQEGVDAIAATLDQPDAAAFRAAVARPNSLTQAAACQATRTLLAGADRLEPSLRVRFLRTLAWVPPPAAQPSHPARGRR